jgi:hypothetical protein
MALFERGKTRGLNFSREKSTMLGRDERFMKHIKTKEHVKGFNKVWHA